MVKRGTDIQAALNWLEVPITSKSEQLAALEPFIQRRIVFRVLPIYWSQVTG